MTLPLLADGISLPIALGFGIGFLALVNLGVAAIEAPVLARGMGTGYVGRGRSYLLPTDRFRRKLVDRHGG